MVALLPVKVIVPAPWVRVLTFELLEPKAAAVKLNPPRLKVPAVRVNVPVADKLSEQVHAPPTPLNVTPPPKVLPFVLIVLMPDVAANVTVEVPA